MLRAFASCASDSIFGSTPTTIYLYNQLSSLGESATTTLQYAEALSLADGPAAALDLLEKKKQEIDCYHLWKATKAEILCRMGRKKEAWVAFQVALAKAPSGSKEDVLRKMALCDFKL